MPVIDLSQSLGSILPAPAARVLVLAPHPDDFDCVAATLEVVRDAGAAIDLAVITGSASGVDDDFCTPATKQRKEEIREAEQRQSCRLFGLPDEALDFLFLEEDEGGHPIDDAANRAEIRERLRASEPAAVFMPHPDDSNAGHRRVYGMFAAAAEATRWSGLALLNEDPKTQAMQTTAYTPFDDEVAGRKAALLRCHRSQHERNLKSRGFGLDDRILEVNRAAARRLELTAPFAEAFEIERWSDGCSSRGDEALRPLLSGLAGDE